ncbi:MAG: hypothetical protein QMC78_00975, partial [Methanocellales archaeon]|nr:hypothetical protein [Methanocellales archaeon]
GYTCKYCHGLSTTQKLHSNSLTITRWDCVDCHSSTGSGPIARYVTKIDTYAHYESYVSCGDNCHAVDQKFHYSTYALGDVVNPGWSGWTIGTPVSCVDCHVDHAGGVPFNAPPDHGTMRPNCEDCHRSPEANTWIKFVHNVITAAGPDCGICHETMVIVIGGSVHVKLNVEALNETILTDPAVKACWACHGNGTEPLGHPPEYKTPLNCTDCHVTCGGEEPYYPPDISELRKGQASLEECLICHNETHVALAGRKMGPLIEDVILSPSLATQGKRIALNARIDEYFLTVKGAEYFIDAMGASGTGVPMAAADGAFDRAEEDAWGVIDTEELSLGNHTIYVHAMDSAGTWGPVSSITLTVSGETWFDFCLKIWRASIGMLYQAYRQAHEWYHLYTPFKPMAYTPFIKEMSLNILEEHGQPLR